MILVLLVVSAIALFLSFIYVHQNTLRISLSVMLTIILSDLDRLRLQE
ncbi:hypothetical protein [Lactiplantibacillus plantarum]